MAEKQEIFNLPRAHCWFVHVFEPRRPTPEAPLQYDCMLVWDKEESKAELRPVVRRLQELGKATFGTKAVKYGLKDGDKLEAGDSLAEELAGKYYANVSSRFRPRVVNGKREDLTDDDEFYSGCYAIAAVHLYTTSHPQGGNRVQLGLDGLQRVGRGPRLGGGKAIDPDEVYDEIEEEDAAGYEADAEDDDDLLA